MRALLITTLYQYKIGRASKRVPWLLICGTRQKDRLWKSSPYCFWERGSTSTQQPTFEKKATQATGTQQSTFDKGCTHSDRRWKGYTTTDHEYWQKKTTRVPNRQQLTWKEIGYQNNRLFKGLNKHYSWKKTMNTRYTTTVFETGYKNKPILKNS